MERAVGDMRGENLIPIIRAGLAQRLERDGLRVKEIASSLNTSPAAVVQYLHGKRGRALTRSPQIDRIVDALAEKILQRVRAGMGEGVRMMELVEAADQIMIASKGNRTREQASSTPESAQVLEILRARLQLELKASERCLESAVKFQDEYSKLLLRMIAADSMRHADVVSQIISWIELSHDSSIEVPRRELLDTILQIEDKAGELSLRDTVKIHHPVAKLLLEWIDADEKKHERIIGKMVNVLQR